MKSFISLAFLLTVTFLTGCQSNNKYEEYYSSLVGNEYVRSDKPAKMLELADISQIAKIQSSDDYILIGTSTFYDLWVPRVFAIDCAKKYGASLIIVSWQKGETKDESITMNIPTSQTTYHHGTVYGSYGSYVNFHGSSTTYGSRPVTINYQNTYYHQQAYFFAKRKNKNPFGIYFQLPENIPGKTDTNVRAAIVVTNSQAEKQGIKVGDIIKSVNGKLIKSAADIMPFVNGTERIEHIEVVHE